MGAVCQVTGAVPGFGHNISFSHRRTKRRFDPNIQKKTYFVPSLGRKVTRYQPDKEVAPGITSVATPGHTPGHSSFIVASGSDKVFVQADVTHTPVFVRNPGWHAMYDQDANMAEATRRKVYDMLAADKMMVQGFHYPFPSRAYIEKTATGYRETMVSWNATL